MTRVANNNEKQSDREVSKMKMSPRKLVQAATVVVLVTCYTTLVLVLQQGGGGSSSNASSPIRTYQPERAPRFLLGDLLATGSSTGSFETASTTDIYQERWKKKRRKETDLDDIFLSVKTTASFHQTRLDVILRTWFVLAREQTYFFTDAEDSLLQSKTNGHLINTNCSSSHNRKALCCKMSVEFDTFLESKKKWFCHFDDDNYVNVPRLVRLLQRYSPREDWYLGKPSIRAPLEIFSRENPKRKVSFWFATGGAGFCLSRALALKMIPIASGGKFISIGEKIRLPDDVTMGYIIEHLLRKKLTVVEDFHSHLEPMKFLKMDGYANQATFSYSKYGREMNVLAIEGFDARIDPTRFLSLHCHLFPNFSYCPR